CRRWSQDVTELSRPGVVHLTLQSFYVIYYIRLLWMFSSGTFGFHLKNGYYEIYSAEYFFYNNKRLARCSLLHKSNIDYYCIINQLLCEISLLIYALLYEQSV